MKHDAHTPSGYCPRCGYRIDPGRCPECGAIISAKQLLRVPPRTRFRRRVRIVVLLILSALLVVGIHRLVVTGAWRRYAPTRVLLAIKNDASRSVFRELVRRYQAGKLTAAQTQQLFDQTLRPRADFKLLDPHPADVRILAKLDIDFDYYWLARQLTTSGPPQVWIDGRQINLQAAPPRNSSYESRMWPPPIQKWGEFALLPGLSPGRHEVIFVQDYLYSSGAPAATPIPPPWTLRVSQTITIVDRPASEFVTVRSDDEPGEIRGEIQLKPDSPRTGWDDPYGRVIPLRFSNVSAPVVGTLEIRLDTEQEFRPIKRIVHDGTARYLEPIDLSGISGINAAQRADVRIVPCPPKIALEYGLREYYGGTIEWPNVLLAINIPVSQANDGLAKVVEFLEPFGEPNGALYRGAGSLFRFYGKLAVFPTELQQDLREHYPQYRFSVARMRYFLGHHTGPLNLMIVSDADSGEVRTHTPALWLDSAAWGFLNSFRGLRCSDVRALEQKALTLASFLSFAMDGEVGTPVVSSTGRTIDVEIFSPQMSIDRPFRRLRLEFDKQLRISLVELLLPPSTNE